MIGSSIKSLWRSDLGGLGWLALSLFTLGYGAQGLEQKYDVRFETQFGYHLVDPRDLAVHRDYLRASTRVKPTDDSPFSAAAGLRGYVEGAYASNPNFSGPVVHDSTHELVLRDLYLQYEEGPVLIRAGQQQVAWGEAFGFFFADIVNPKDLRTLGIGELEDLRVPTPMLNAKLIFSDVSFQALYIPKPYFNKLAQVGSDFAFPLSRYLGPGNYTLDPGESLSLSLEHAEYGARATALVSGVDLSLFFLSYYDRMPNFDPRLISLSPITIALEGSHPRVISLGATATADLSTFVLRAESVVTHDRHFDAISDGILTHPRADEVVAVLGVDYTQFEKWQLGVQLSHDFLLQDVPGSFYAAQTPQLMLHLHGTPWHEHSLDAILSYAPRDGSSLAELRYGIPISGSLVFGVAGDLLQGGATSRFGQYQRASRIYLTLNGYFSG